MSTKDHVAVRLDKETLTRIDAVTALLDTEWRDATRSDVLRLLILRGRGVVGHPQRHHPHHAASRPSNVKRDSIEPRMPMACLDASIAARKLQRNMVNQIHTKQIIECHVPAVVLRRMRISPLLVEPVIVLRGLELRRSKNHE
jgi:hypothetical protein